MDVHALAVPRALPRERASWTGSPWAAAAFVALAYVLLMLPTLVRDPYEFVHVGHKFAHRATTSSVITPSLPSHHPIGYDGQFYFFVAADPEHAKDYLDEPGVVYSRIGYPMTVRALSGGKASVVPYMMALVNIAAAVGGTLAVAFLLRRRGLPPLLALLYGLFPGLMIAVLRDLTEPLAFGLVAAGLAVFNPRSRWRLWGSACLFGSAMLTRETIALFPAILALGLLVGAGGAASGFRERLRVGNLFRASGFAAFAFLPLFAWRHTLTSFWLHDAHTQEHFTSGASSAAGGAAGAAAAALVPFHAVASQWPWTGEDVTDLLTVVVPALVWTGIAIAVLRHKLSLEPWFVLANVLVFVLLLPTPIAVDYPSMGRAAIGILLAVMVMLPQAKTAFPARWSTTQRALALWSLPFYIAVAILLKLIGPTLV